MSALDPTRPLAANEYRATPAFRAIDEHACVCFADDQGLVATTGEAGDEQAAAYATLFALAPQMLRALRGVVADVESREDVADLIGTVISGEWWAMAVDAVVRLRDVERATGEADRG